MLVVYVSPFHVSVWLTSLEDGWLHYGMLTWAQMLLLFRVLTTFELQINCSFDFPLVFWEILRYARKTLDFLGLLSSFSRQFVLISASTLPSQSISGYRVLTVEYDLVWSQVNILVRWWHVCNDLGFRPNQQALPEEYLPGDVMEPGKLDEMFDRMDANNDGRISFEEFKEAIEVNNFLQEAVLFPLRQQSG